MATIRKRGNAYQLRCSIGYDHDGKQITRTKTWVPPTGWSEKRAEKEALNQAVLFEEQVRKGELIGKKIKFSEFAEKWFAEYANSNLRPRTLARYRELLARINVNLGHFQLEAIRPDHLLALYNELANEEPANTSYVCKIDLKGQIKDSGSTKSQFAKDCGVSETTLSVAFHRKPISRVCAEKISKRLGADCLSLFSPTVQRKVLSPTTVRQYHRLISKIMADAVQWQYIPYNPCTRVAPPKNKSPEIAYLDDEQALHLVKLLRSEEGFYRRAALLLLLTGLRRGELLGLEWQDVDWEKKALFISRTLQYLPKKGLFIGEPKTKRSKRLVYLPDQAITVLREQLLWQKRQALAMGSAWQASPRIFTSPDGSPLQPDRLTKWFSKFIRKTDLPPIHIHSLRHTYATLCIAKGVPLTAVSAQLGHASVSTTANIYAHAIKSAQLVAVDAFGRLFADAI